MSCSQSKGHSKYFCRCDTWQGFLVWTSSGKFPWDCKYCKYLALLLAGAPGPLPLPPVTQRTGAGICSIWSRGPNLDYTPDCGDLEPGVVTVGHSHMAVTGYKLQLQWPVWCVRTSAGSLVCDWVTVFTLQQPSSHTWPIAATPPAPRPIKLSSRLTLPATELWATHFLDVIISLFSTRWPRKLPGGWCWCRAGGRKMLKLEEEWFSLVPSSIHPSR